MSLTVTQRPSITTPNISRWNAVGNPIIYKFTRKDFTFNQVNNNAGNIQLQFNAVNIAASFSLNDVVWVESNNGVYSASGLVTASTYSAPDTLVTIDIPYTAVAPGGYVNNETKRVNYKVSIGVYTSSLIGTIRISPDRQGNIIADVSRVLWADMNPDITIDLTSVNNVMGAVDSGGFKPFYIKYREVWIGSAESETDDSSQITSVVYGANQIPSPYGSNLLDYVILSNSESVNDTSFTSGWTNQATGTSWVFSSSMISVLGLNTFSKRGRRSFIGISGSIININLKIAISPIPLPVQIIIYLSNGQFLDLGLFNHVDSNANASFTLSSDISYFEIECINPSLTTGTTLEITEVNVNRRKFLTKLDELVMWRYWPMPVSCIINGDNALADYLLIEEASENTIGSFEPSDPSLCIFDLNKILLLNTGLNEFNIQILQRTTNYKISERKKVLVKDACENAIMLLARNTLGGCLSWVFDYSQEYTFSYEDGSKAKRLILFAENLTLNQWEALQDFVTLGDVYMNNIVELLSSNIKTSSRIGSQVYAVDRHGNKVGVIVIPTQNTTRTKQSKHTFSIEIEYPELFTT